MSARPFVVGDRVRAIYFSDMAVVGTVLAVAGDDVTVRYEWDEVVHHGPALRHVSDGAPGFEHNAVRGAL